jgi:serine protease Do
MRNYYLNTSRIRSMFKDSVVRSIMVSFLTVIVTIGVLSGCVWYYRASLLKSLGVNSVASVQSTTPAIVSSASSSIITPESVASSVRSAVVSPTQHTVVDVVKLAQPAVVSIIVSKEVPKYDVSYQESNFGLGIVFKTPTYTQNGTEKKEIGSGSGFLISSDGLIVTNRHVVDDKTAIYDVSLNNGTRYPAKVLARDRGLDVAVIKIDVSGLPFLTFADSDKLEVGESVIAIGNALGQFKNSVSTGVVSGLSRSIVAGDTTGKSELLDKVIQTDAAINPGNSGGPLLNLEGHVVGINVATVVGSSNVGFSLPINSVKSVISSVVKTGKIVRPYAGIRYTAITPETKSTLGLAVDYGVLVQKGTTASEPAVISGSPADKAGIVEGDIILEVNGQKINSNFTTLIRGKKIGDTLILKVLSKDGTQRTVSVTLEQAPADL